MSTTGRLSSKRGLNINSGDINIPSSSNNASIQISRSRKKKHSDRCGPAIINTSSNQSLIEHKLHGEEILNLSEVLSLNPQLCLSFGYKQNQWPTPGSSFETICNTILIVIYLSFYGLIIAIPYFVYAKESLFYTALTHAGQFIILCLALMRSSYWCAVLKDRGYLYFPHSIKTSRKIPITIFVVSNCILSLFMAWSTDDCDDPTTPCLLKLTKQQLITIFLGIETCLISLAWITYTFYIFFHLKNVKYPDVVQELFKERQFLSASGNSAIENDENINNMMHGEWSGPLLSVTDDDTRLLSYAGHSIDGEGDELRRSTGDFNVPVNDNQHSIIRYLRHRNQVLSAKLVQLQAKIDTLNNNNSSLYGI